MFGVGSGEIILILVIAMLVVGPERMVTFARDAGEMLAKFRRETDSVTSEFKEAFSLDTIEEKDDQRLQPKETVAVDTQASPAPASSSSEIPSPSIAPATSSFADSQVTRVRAAQHAAAESGIDGAETTTVLAMPEEDSADQIDAYELTVIEGPEIMDDDESAADTTIRPVQNEG